MRSHLLRYSARFIALAVGLTVGYASLGKGEHAPLSIAAVLAVTAGFATLKSP